MITTDRYSAILNVRHYEVVEWFQDINCEPYTGKLHRDYAKIEAELSEWRRTRGHNENLSVIVMQYDTVVLPRCAECAALPADDPTVYADWWEMREALQNHPGWVATSDERVFCPNHQPAREL